MKHLKSIIGLSPSEQSIDEYIAKVLEPERKRVREALDAFAQQKTPSQKRKAPTGKITAAKLRKLMKEYGLTAEELGEIMES